jgi:hypothetical protein
LSSLDSEHVKPHWQQCSGKLVDNCYRDYAQRNGELLQQLLAA